MPTSAAVAVFLFAHQDDEFGVYHAIRAELAAGHRVVCAYLTDGATPTASPQQRNVESLRVLGRLGVAAHDIQFAGQALQVADGRLMHHVAALRQWVEETLDQAQPLARVYVPAWEGGHPDHDVLHAVAAQVAQRRGVLDRCRQFSLYNSNGLSAPFFRVLSPLAANGPVSRERMPWRERLRNLRLCLGYPSQWKSWLGLFPFVLWHMVFDGTQALQPLDPARTRQRPHPGQLYYEARGFATWERIDAVLQAARR